MRLVQSLIFSYIRLDLFLHFSKNFDCPLNFTRHESFKLAAPSFFENSDYVPYLAVYKLSLKFFTNTSHFHMLSLIFLRILTMSLIRCPL